MGLVRPDPELVDMLEVLKFSSYVKEWNYMSVWFRAYVDITCLTFMSKVSFFNSASKHRHVVMS